LWMRGRGRRRREEAGGEQWRCRVLSCREGGQHTKVKAWCALEI
jgi:hypothetical protein